MKSTRVRFLSAFLSFFLAFAALPVAFLCGAEESASRAEEITPPYTTSVFLTPSKYEFADNNEDGYEFGFQNRVTSYSNGIDAMGSLKIEGTGLVETTYGGVPAIAVKSGTAPIIKYTQSIESRTHEGRDWFLSYDAAKSVSDVSVPGSVQNGAFLVFKSDDGERWSLVGLPVVNINGEEQTYGISSEDLQKGTFFKIVAVAEVAYTYISGYHTEYSNWWDRLWGVRGYAVPDYANHYRNLGAEYTFFVGDDSLALSLTRSDTSGVDFNNSGEYSETELEYIKKANSLTDGAVSFSDLKVDLLGIRSNRVTVSVNGGPSVAVADGTRYTSPGSYRFRVESVFGTVEERNVYIMDMKDDLGFSSIFGDGFVDDAKEMFDDQYKVPTFMTGTKIGFSALPNSPGLYGTLSFSSDGENSVVIEEFEGVECGFSKVLTEEGVYIADLYTSSPSVACGDLAHYVIIFSISENTNYAPSVNQKLLKDTSRNLLFRTKMNVVAVKTAGGGSFLYSFPCSDEFYPLAYELAEQVEMLSVESYDGYWYYKDANNPNVKVKYEGNHGKRLLFEVLGHYARANVNTIYADASCKYAIEPLKDANALADLTKASLARDVKVVLDENVKKALQADEVYLNDFSFEQVATFESESVVLVDQLTGEVIPVKYGEDLSQYFKTSSRFTVVETNWNGTSRYDVTYYSPEENHGVLRLLVDGVEHQINSTYAGGMFAGDSVTIADGGDSFDSQAILSIRNLNSGERRVLHLSEARGIALPQGEYEISAINRFGIGYAFNVRVEKEIPEAEVAAFSTLYRDYNASFFTEIPDGEVEETAPVPFDFFTVSVILLLLVGVVCIVTALTMKKKRY